MGDVRITTEFGEALRGIAVDGEDRVVAVGDSAVKVFDPAGGFVREWATALPGYSVAVDAAGRIWVGEFEQVELFDAEGRLLDTLRDGDRIGLITAVVVRGDELFLADARARWIRRYAVDGTFKNNIGDKHRKGGFHIPNGIVDFDVDETGIVWVANPGMHRVERYTAEGELLGHIGRFDGVDPAGFPGCCNPTNVGLDRAGRIVVTEKAGPRAKLYDRDGTLLSVIADEGFDPASKNMDLAVDSEGRILVADTARMQIRVFAPAGPEAAR